MTLRNGAVLTHPAATATTRSSLVLNITGQLRIDGTSRIDVSGRGFLGGRSGDNTADEGRTLGNVPGSTRRNGGSYGGLGGPGNVPGVSNPVYGDFRDPNLPGSGGASEGGAGGNGGGVLRITADSLVLDGEIAADGGNGVGRVAAGGSGGAIRIDVGTIAGAGTIHANGGEGNGGGFEAGGGGGGRIALYYDEAGGFDLSRITAFGRRGPFALDGGAGTVFVKAADRTFGDLVVDSAGGNPASATPLYSLLGGTSTELAPNALTDATADFIPGTLIGLELNPNRMQGKTFTVIANDATTLFTDPADGDMTEVAGPGDTYGGEPVLDRLQVSSHARLEVVDGDQNRPDRRGLLTATDLMLVDEARLEHPAATLASFFGLEIDVSGTLSIDETSRIDVSGRGFLGGRSGDNTANEGRTLGNVPGSTRRNGGSYGGLGGTGNVAGVSNPVYGDPRNPNEPGSGGASESGAGGNGGGLIRLVAGAIQLDGEIAADGGDGVGLSAAGGSGGAIRIDAGTLAGTGTIHADGGKGHGGAGGGGGGGRVAVYGASALDPADITAAGGTGFQPGEPGTVVVEP
ncbi:MAG: hypothetical protein KatS3mg076_0065 [Candidatus Binatia bacterium]|nr:MAG: hypothetical protein KatS3mg076_0065 [Candidatus Binatia bacterium]